MTRSKFDIEYNKWLQQVDVEEGDNVWNEIQDELDFMETWDNISTKLDEVKPQKGRVVPMRFLKLLAATAAILLIMFLPVRYIIDQANQPTNISELSNEGEKTEETISDETALNKTAKDEDKLVTREVTILPPKIKINEKSLASSASNELTPIFEIKDSESTAYSNNEIDLTKVQILPFDANTLLVSNNAFPPLPSETKFKAISEPSKSSGISFRVVDIGLVYGYKNTWLLNNETRNGLNPRKLGNALPTFHQDIGVSSAFEVNNRHLLGLEFLWKSEAGQDYQQYINASYVERKINLDYLKLQAFYLWGNRRIPGQAIVGGYFARLTMAEEQQAKTSFNVDNRYCDLDYGLLAGYQFNIALKNRIIIKPGVRVSYNLVNIFEGDAIAPSHFKRTKNLAASFNISLSYRLFK